MEAISDAQEAMNDYGPSAVNKAGRGAKALIEDYTPQADVVYRVMESCESGMSLGNTVVVLNQWRRRSTLEPISYGCLQRFVRCSAVMVLTRTSWTGRRRRGPSAVLAEFKILGWGGAHRRQLVRGLPFRNKVDGGKPSCI